MKKFTVKYRHFGMEMTMQYDAISIEQAYKELKDWLTPQGIIILSIK